MARTVDIDEDGDLWASWLRPFEALGEIITFSARALAGIPRALRHTKPPENSRANRTIPPTRASPE